MSKDTLTTAIEIIGAGLIVSGVGIFSIPCALITAGAILLFGGWLVSK